jgi:anti-sigma factor RsiW
MNRFKKPDNKSEHRYYEDRLSAYLDGELAPREQNDVERHLATCQTCQWDLNTLRQTVQWIGELPAVPLPRVFTVPAPAQRVRAPRRRWSFLPVLQGATVLVALLLFFAVAGDFWLGSFRTASAPDLMVMQEAAPAPVEATMVVEVIEEVELAVPAEPEAVAEKTVIETVEVEKEVVVEAPALTPTPTPQTAPAAEAPAEEIMALKATPEEGLAGAAAASPEAAEESTGEGQADATARAMALPPSATATLSAVASGGITPTVVTSPSPTPIYTDAEPTLVAEARAPALAEDEQQELAPAGTWRQPGVSWLRVLEASLAVSFLLLATATVIFTLRRRGAG